MSIKY